MKIKTHTKARDSQNIAMGTAASATSGEINKPPTGAVTTTPIDHDDAWTRLPKPGQMLCGMTRSFLYQLCAKGAIRSVTIRQPQNTRGIRLVYRPSIHAYLKQLDHAQNEMGEA